MPGEAAMTTKRTGTQSKQRDVVRRRWTVVASDTRGRTEVGEHRRE
jgi:hypothetical protein